MKEKDYNKNVAIGVICNMVGLFIFGYIFSGIAYSQFDKNYKNFLDDYEKRRRALWGKVISVFLISMSLSYHSQSRENPLDERMIASCIVAGIFAVISYLVLNSKDKKIPIQKKKKVKFKCSECGTLFNEDSIRCPKCGLEFEEEKIELNSNMEKEMGSNSDIASKYSDLIKLKDLLDKDIITKEEFEREKKKILK